MAKFRQGATAPKMHIYCTSPGDGQTSCKVWLASSERHRCRNEAKTQNPIKFAGVPQTSELISAVSGSKFTKLWGHVEEILVFNTFFDCDTCLSCEDIAQRSCAMVHRRRIFGDFLRPAFPASRLQHTSDLHSKFALGPHHV